MHKYIQKYYNSMYEYLQEYIHDLFHCLTMDQKIATTAVHCNISRACLPPSVTSYFRHVTKLQYDYDCSYDELMTTSYFRGEVPPWPFAPSVSLTDIDTVV